MAHSHKSYRVFTPEQHLHFTAHFDQSGVFSDCTQFCLSKKKKTDVAASNVLYCCLAWKKKDGNKTLN